MMHSQKTQKILNFLLLRRKKLYSKPRRNTVTRGALKSKATKRGGSKREEGYSIAGDACAEKRGRGRWPGKGNGAVEEARG